MLKLAKDFYITAINKRFGYRNSSLEEEYLYTFIYKEYQIELRYKRFDKLFCKNYTKKELDIDKYNSLYKICGNYKEDENKTIWVYAKKESHLLQLKEVVK